MLGHNQMKKCFIFALIILFVITIPVSAHPGSTDENGGHHDRDTGEYHYHHGYPAHQHTDGVCPYDYDDKTNHSSSSSTRSSDSTSYTNSNSISRTTQTYKGSSVDTIVYVSNGMYHSLNCPIKGKNCVERKLIDVYNEKIPGCTTCVLPRLTYSQIDEYNATHKPTPSSYPTTESDDRNISKELYDWEPVIKIVAPIIAIWGLLMTGRKIIENRKGKIQYCKYCGGKIDNATKQCTSCGKGSFIKRHSSSIVIILLTILLTATFIFAICLVTQNINLKEKITLLESSNSELVQTVSDLTLELSTLSENYTLLETSKNELETSKNELETEYKENTRAMIDAIWELGDYQNDFAYVTAAGEKYHKKSCSILLNEKTLYCDTIYKLKQSGYSPCLICYSN